MRHFTGSVSDKGGCRLMPAIIPIRLRVHVSMYVSCVRVYVYVYAWVCVRASGYMYGCECRCVYGWVYPSVHACLLRVSIYSDFRQCETHNRI